MNLRTIQSLSKQNQSPSLYYYQFYSLCFYYFVMTITYNKYFLIFKQVVILKNIYFFLQKLSIKTLGIFGNL